MNTAIKVGFGRVDIMPIGSVELGGMGNGPFCKSENILDTLCATCIAITDAQEQTLLMITMDLLHALDGMVAEMRKNITAATGTPGEHIMIAATHTHAGPDIFNPGPQTGKDYIASVRSYLEVALDCNFAFFQGAGGNLTTRSQLQEEACEREMNAYGKRQGDEAISLLGSLRELTPAPLQLIQRQYQCSVDHTTDWQVPQATELWNF